MDVKVKRALISVSDKSGVIDFARKLSEMGVQIISTGGTAKQLAKEGIEVTGSVWGYIFSRQKIGNIRAFDIFAIFE